MNHSRNMLWAATSVAAAVTMMGLLPGAAWGAAARPQAQSSCVALGTYRVRQSSLAESAVRPHASQGRRMRTTTASPVHPWDFQGTLIISAYTGCGIPTRGTFSMSRAMAGPPPAQPITPNPSGRCSGPCPRPVTGLLGVSGTFAQDTVHGADPLYVTVSAAMTMTRPGPPHGPLCSDETGCPPFTVITSTVAFTSVTGYLQGGVTAGSSVTLSFLPPPAPHSAVAPVALTVMAGRGPQPLAAGRS